MMGTDQIGGVGAGAGAAEASSGLDLGAVLKRRKLLLVLGLAAGAGLAYLHYIRQPPVYQSSARILLTSKSGKGLPLQQAGIQVQNNLNNELMLLRSEELLQEAIADGDLKLKPTFKRLGTSALASGLKIQQLNDTSILQISFQGSRPDDCRAAVAAVTQTYKRYVERDKAKGHQEIKDIIVNLVTGVQKELKETEDKYEQFTENTRLLFAGDGEMNNQHAARVSAYSEQVTAAVLEETRIQSEMSIIKAALEEGGQGGALDLLVDRFAQVRVDAAVRNGDGVSLPKEQNLSARLFDLRRQLAQAQEQYGVKHPKVEGLKFDIKFTKDFLEKERAASDAQGLAEDLVEVPEQEQFDPVAAYLGRLNLELAQVKTQKVELKKMVAMESEASKGLSQEMVENRNLNRAIARLTETNAEMINLLKDVSIVQEYEGREATVIAPASVANTVGPDFAKIMTTGSVLGLLAGFGLACLIELADKSFRSPDDLMAELGIPVLSHIPFMREAKKRQDATASSVGNALITVLRPKSRTAEAYRSVRTALYFSTSGEVNKIVQVTSPVAGDGKSTLAGNLAVAIANSGKRVLLVDADLRRPTVHKVFGLSNKHGVSTVVSGSCGLDDAVHKTEVENLHVLTCGPRPDNPSEMLLSPEFEQLLEYVRAAFDFVVIDSPPILAVTDPASLAARADGVIITLRLAKRSRDLAKRAVDQLQNVGANILGVVVNGVDSVESYGYRSYSYGGYGYGGYGQGYGGYYANGNGGYYDDAAKQPSAPKRVKTGNPERTKSKS